MSNCVTSCDLYCMTWEDGGELVICENSLPVAQRRRIVALEAIYRLPTTSGGDAVDKKWPSTDGKAFALCG